MKLPVSTGAPYRGYRLWRVIWLRDETAPALASIAYRTYWPGPVSRVPAQDLDNPWWGLWACRSPETLAAALPKLVPGCEPALSVYVFGEISLLAPCYVRHERGARGAVARIVRLWWPPHAAATSYCSRDHEYRVDWWAPVHSPDAISFGYPLRLGRGTAEHKLTAIGALLEARYDCAIAQCP